MGHGGGRPRSQPLPARRTLSCLTTRPSARAGREAAFHAATQARERYRAGTITQLDLLQAQRDAFNAEVSRIQADADLVNARAQLRLSSGQSLFADSGRKGTP